MISFTFSMISFTFSMIAYIFSNDFLYFIIDILYFFHRWPEVPTGTWTAEPYLLCFLYTVPTRFLHGSCGFCPGAGKGSVGEVPKQATEKGPAALPIQKQATENNKNIIKMISHSCLEGADEHLDCQAGFFYVFSTRFLDGFLGFYPAASQLASQPASQPASSEQASSLAPAPFIHLLGLEAPSKFHTYQQGW